MIADPKDPKVYAFSDSFVESDPVSQDYKKYRSHHTPLVVDNGSGYCRAGWSTEDTPRLVFRNVVTKVRTKKSDSDMLCVGNDIKNLETVRSSLKSPFDHNVVTNFSCQEHVLDYVFYHLGLGAEPRVVHPIVLTEAVCNPSYCRSNTSELLFEGYGVPSVAYGIDAMYSLLYNASLQGLSRDDALVISCGHHTAHVLPVVGGRLDTQYCKRINLGGTHMIVYMQKLVQLKAPTLQHLITQSRAQELVYSHCYFAGNYGDELGEWEKGNRESFVRKVQLSFFKSALENAPDPLKDLRDSERRKKAGERLKEFNKKRKAEKLLELQKRLKELSVLLALQEEDPDSFEDAMEASGFASYEAILKEVSNTNTAISKLSLSKSATKCSEEFPIEEAVSEEWLESIRARKKELQTKRQERQLHHKEMSQRKSAASHKRMKIISQLADDTITKKGRKPTEDTFGMNDEDWAVYREISKDGGGSESEKDEAELQEIDKILEKHDPKFKKVSVQYSERNANQFFLGLERSRVPEILYQPSLIGMDQCGLAETIQCVLQSYPADVQQRMVNNVFATGGPTLTEGFRERLAQEVLAIRPFNSPFTINCANDKLLDGWKGAAKWSRGLDNKQYFITRSEYQEHGKDFIKPFNSSNPYTKLHV